jgi:hypothetical protein
MIAIGIRAHQRRVGTPDLLRDGEKAAFIAPIS